MVYTDEHPGEAKHIPADCRGHYIFQIYIVCKSCPHTTPLINISQETKQYQSKKQGRRHLTNANIGTTALNMLMVPQKRYKQLVLVRSRECQTVGEKKKASHSEIPTPTISDHSPAPTLSCTPRLHG